MTLKINSDGNLIIERGTISENKDILEVLSPHIDDENELKNFLLQLEGRKVLLGDSNLCG
ncbi:MAG: hypothetical protein WC755_01945 [Candidatus Woesearchaeota archaeon]|jgi:hypothetical protein